MGERALLKLQETLVDVLAAQNMTRTGLLSELDISRSTLFRALNPLVDQGYVLSISKVSNSGKGRSKAGRKSVVLALARNTAYVLGVDIRRDHAVAVVVNRHREVLVRRELALAEYNGWQPVLHRLCAEIDEASEPVDMAHLEAVAVGLPVPVETRCTFDPHPSDFHSALLYDVHNTVQDYWDAPVFVDNTVRMDAASEARWGAGKDVKDMLFVNLSKGIALTPVSNSTIIRGFAHLAGEIGHIAVPGNTMLCYCGKSGCLETVASFDALLTTTSADSPEDFAERYRANDPTVRDAMASAVEAITGVLTSSILLLNPQMIVVGGTLVEAVPDVVDQIRDGISGQSLPEYGAGPEVLAAQPLSTKMGLNAVASYEEHRARMDRG